MHQAYRQGQALKDDLVNARLAPGHIGFWHLGQSGVVIRGGGGLADSFAVDPYLTQSPDEDPSVTEWIRAFAPPIEPEDLAGIGAVLISHQHSDHLDIETLTRLHAVSKETTFVVPAPHVGILVEAGIPDAVIVPASADETLYLPHRSWKIQAIAAAHTEYERDEAGHDLYLGYAITLDDVCVYHSGDTVVTDALVETLERIRPEVALLPINGADFMRTRRGIIGNMSFRDAVDLAAHLGVKLLLPNHYDLYPNNRDNPAYFVDYLFHHHPALPFHMMAVGERFVYRPNLD